MTSTQPEDDGQFFISNARPTDQGAIAHLHGQLFEQGWDANFVGDFIADPACKVLLARAPDTQRLSGFVILQCAADQAEVLSLGVVSSRQRRGLGAALVRAALDAAIEAGIARVFLEVASDNLPAQKLYARFGLQQIDIRKNYYRQKDGGFCDALVLSVALTPAQP